VDNLKDCPNCKHELAPGQKFCDNCGAAIAPKKVRTAQEVEGFIKSTEETRNNIEGLRERVAFALVTSPMVAMCFWFLGGEDPSASIKKRCGIK